MLRNAGGVVTDDVVRSLTISQRKLGTREILVVQHTGCGLATFTDEDFSEELCRARRHAPAVAHTRLREPGGERAARSGPVAPRPVPAARRRWSRGFVLDIEAFTLDEIR